MHEEVMEEEAPEERTRLAEQVRELIRTSNDYMLEASRQGGFLAAGVIAAAPLWSANGTSGSTTKASLALLVVSMIASGLAHFLLGFSARAMIIRALPALRGEQVSSDDREWLRRKAARWHSLATPPWCAGIGQALCLFAGLLLAGYVFVASEPAHESHRSESGSEWSRPHAEPESRTDNP